LRPCVRLDDFELEEFGDEDDEEEEEDDKEEEGEDVK
jgi:hypothetical protein